MLPRQSLFILVLFLVLFNCLDLCIFRDLQRNRTNRIQIGIDGYRYRGEIYYRMCLRGYRDEESTFCKLGNPEIQWCKFPLDLKGWESEAQWSKSCLRPKPENQECQWPRPGNGHCSSSGEQTCPSPGLFVSSCPPWTGWFPLSLPRVTIFTQCTDLAPSLCWGHPHRDTQK